MPNTVHITSITELVKGRVLDKQKFCIQIALYKLQLFLCGISRNMKLELVDIEETQDKVVNIISIQNRK